MAADVDEVCWLLMLLHVQGKVATTLSQAGARTPLNGDLSDLSMKVLWDSITAFRQRSATLSTSFAQDFEYVS